MKKKCAITFLLLVLLAACNFPAVTDVRPTTTPSEAATTTPTPTTTADDSSLAHYPSQAKFQVFILNPVRTCLAGNDFASGNVCFGEKCGDCQCAWEDFDPPAPMTGIPPARIHDPEYAVSAHRVCMDTTLTHEDVAAIEQDMRLLAEKVFARSAGDLALKLSFTELPFDYACLVAPDLVFAPSEVDVELLNPYVCVDTDCVYVGNGVNDPQQNLNLAYACGGSYGEMSSHGAGYANIQYGPACNSIVIDGKSVYEPLIHEWYHNLDWALLNINQVPDALEGKNPDWSAWKRGSLPACGAALTGLTWFPSIDFCEWDPDWMDCNNTQSAGRCVHAGELDGEMSWYEHVIRAHYPGAIRFVGNYCRDGRQDVSETGVDSGWPCP